MRKLAIAWLAVGCQPTPVRPPREPAPARAPALCRGLTDDACTDRALRQSLCLLVPDGTGCDELRRAGLLPPPPPPLASLLTCWRVEEPHEDVPTSWICLGDRDLAIHGTSGWNVWPHAGWQRQDARDHAGWTAILGDRRQVWLTVLPDGSVTRLHVGDGTGSLSATMVAGDRRLACEIARRRRALPAIDEVCRAARACAGAMPRPVPAEEIDLPVDDPLAGAVTLRDCLGAWSTLSTRLDFARVPIPASCATVSQRSGWRWLEPPFAPVGAWGDAGQ